MELKSLEECTSSQREFIGSTFPTPKGGVLTVVGCCRGGVMRSVKALSLFSGIGGGDIALEWCDVGVVGMCEIDEYCQSILKQHFPDTPLYFDIKALSPEQFGNIDILLTTFPCQPVSVAGKQKGDKDDRWLWKENIKFIRHNKPIFVIGENVRGLLTKGLSGVEDDLREEGYEVRSYVLSAKDIGATHLRERVFIIGYKPRGQSPNTASNGCNGEQKFNRYREADARAEERTHQIECSEGCGKVRNILPTTPVTKSWGVVPKFRGVDDGLPERLDKADKQRIKALGNSVMPQQIYPFIKSCVEVINALDSK